MPIRPFCQAHIPVVYLEFYDLSTQEANPGTLQLLNWHDRDSTNENQTSQNDILPAVDHQHFSLFQRNKPFLCSLYNCLYHSRVCNVP